MNELPVPIISLIRLGERLPGIWHPNVLSSRESCSHCGKLGSLSLPQLATGLLHGLLLYIVYRCRTETIQYIRLCCGKQPGRVKIAGLNVPT